jgi:hypothetical protein
MARVTWTPPKAGGPLLSLTRFAGRIATTVASQSVAAVQNRSGRFPARSGAERCGSVLGSRLMRFMPFGLRLATGAVRLWETESLPPTAVMTEETA